MFKQISVNLGWERIWKNIDQACYIYAIFFIRLDNSKLKTLENNFFYQQKYDYIIYNVKYSTRGTIVYTTYHHTKQSYGNLIHAVHQELGDHRFDCRLGTQSQYL